MATPALCDLTHTDSACSLFLGLHRVEIVPHWVLPIPRMFCTCSDHTALLLCLTRDVGLLPYPPTDHKRSSGFDLKRRLCTQPAYHEHTSLLHFRNTCKKL